MLLKAAEQLAADGTLPVNLRVVCDGERDRRALGRRLARRRHTRRRRGVVFDSGYVKRGVPAFNIAARGLCYFHVTVKTGSRDLHSGVYGGASLNAMHALVRTRSRG